MARKATIETEQVHELLYQALETELGGVKIYETAISLRGQRRPAQGMEGIPRRDEPHRKVVPNVFETLGLDTGHEDAGPQGRRPHRRVAGAAMEMALKGGDTAAAELVACECVVLAETKDHANWELIGHVAEHGKGEQAKVLKQAHEAVEKDEDHHLYHTNGWCRELWIQSLGFPAVLPPPEEVKQVETAIGASRAEQARE